jgi:AraC-like DNA-binding protein
MFSDFYHIGAIISVFLGLVILFRKNKTAQNYILAIWLIIMGINIFLYHRLNDHKENQIILSYINIILLTIQIPAALIFVKSYTDENKKIILKILLYVILPVVINSILYYIAIKDGTSFSMPIVTVVYLFVAFPGFLIYSIISLRKLKSITLQQISDTESNDATIIKRFLLGILTAYLIFVFVYIASVFFNFASIENAFGSAIVALSLSVIYAGLFGLQRSDIFIVHNYKNNISEKPAPSESEKIILEKTIVELEACMKDKKPYLRPRLSLKELSDISEIPETQISTAINIILDQNFYDYINSLRVDEFISRCKKKANRDYTLTGIAFECGFNSKSSFFEIFKKQTGKTPSQFIKSL